ncbi:MAG: CehA/McbA family metallohydrolase [Chloroflexi bacterium]|nr:CehA/McbA family metallohydrolase [Chloroflexota bacterium]
MKPIEPMWHESAGHIHFHTTYSDGSGSFEEIASAAEEAGLDFLITTDHNVLVPEADGRRRGVLVLVGEEINDKAREPEVNHLLVAGIEQDVFGYAKDPQALINAVAAQGGVSFLAHPIERNSRYFPKDFNWVDWNVQGYDGIELWNFMSECKAYVNSKAVGLLLSLRPQIFVRGPWPEVLALWDRLTDQRPVVAIGGSDNHAGTYRVGPFTRHVFPYAFGFRTVNTHILTPEPFSGDLAHDREQVYGALRAGHGWVGYDLLGSTAGFRFRGRSDDQAVIMGDTLPAGQAVQLEATVPHRARLRLLRDGQPVAQTWGRRLRYTATAPGVYRVEAHRWAWSRWRGWIFSNPIYVRESTS